MNQHRRKASEITVDRLRETLFFDEQTGHIHLKRATPNGQKAAGDRVGSIDFEGYDTVTVDKVRLRAHRIVWALHYGEWPNGSLDHINGVRTDNRVANLRIANHSQNGANTLANRSNRHGTKGITPLPNGKWQAQIKCNGKARYLGCFASKEEAAAVYAEAARAAFGEFSGLERAA